MGIYSSHGPLPDDFGRLNAVAEPRRRQILDLLAQGERPVNDVAASLGLAQPQVSKHLRVLREVGLVSVRGFGSAAAVPAQRRPPQAHPRLGQDLRAILEREPGPPGRIPERTPEAGDEAWP